MTELIRTIIQIVAPVVWQLSLFGEVFYYYFFIAGPNALLFMGVVFLFFDDVWDGVAGAIGFALIPISIVSWVAVRSTIFRRCSCWDSNVLSDGRSYLSGISL